MARSATPQRERSVRQLVDRVVPQWTEWGVRAATFASDWGCQVSFTMNCVSIAESIRFLQIPVWFNCGIEPKPQVFRSVSLNSVEDTMESILDLARTEGRPVQMGFGNGNNLSPLRSSRAKLSGGGIASGPVSFMKGFDAFAGVIKSGGKTRRAAKMVILNIDHPDIVEFIECKAREERKAWVLIDQRLRSGGGRRGLSSIFFQNRKQCSCHR